MEDARPDLRRGLAPVLDAGIRVLVLGSFPGEASLAARQYYAHPRNQFWRLLGAALGEPALPDLAYEARLDRVLAHGIGIWDVLATCRRAGSLDSAIRQPEPNDFDALRVRAPRLRKICFNGRMAGRFAGLAAAAGYETLALPSSSPAYAARSFEQKLSLWRGIPT